MKKRWIACVLLALVGCLAPLASARERRENAPPAAMPEQPGPPPAAAPAHSEQHLLPAPPTLDEEMARVTDAAAEPYRKVGLPRLLILFNRDMEDNDDRTMEKQFKADPGGGSVQIERSEGKAEVNATPGRLEASAKSERQKLELEGRGGFYVRKAPGPERYTPHERAVLREGFERPFLHMHARIADRDTAIRKHALTDEAVFGYPDLAETKRGQIAALMEVADVLVTVEAERGQALERKVAGDRWIPAPYLVARAVRLSDAAILAAATTADVKPKGEAADIATQVALELLRRLAAAWGEEPVEEEDAAAR